MRTRMITSVALIGLIVGLLAAQPVLAGKPGRIVGWLTDTETGQPIAAAWVALIENNRGVYTDSLGYFVIENVPSGSYTLIVTHPDYSTVSGLPALSVIVKPGADAQVRTAISQIKKKETNYMPAIVGIPKPAGGAGNETTLSIDDGDFKPTDRIRREPPVVSVPNIDQSIGVLSDIQSTMGQGSIAKCAPYPREYDKYDKYDEYESRMPYDMFFKDYGTNGFVDPRHDRFSTFATDVDDASYTLVRRYLREGNMPPTDAVRVEEFVNHFNYGYNNPSRERFRMFTEMTDSPFESGTMILKIGIKGQELDKRDRKPLRLTFVVDVSGSMGRGNRLGLVKQSLKLLAKQLNRRDRVAIVAYGSHASVVLQSTPGDRRGEIKHAIDYLSAGGSTYAEAGLNVGYRIANNQYERGSSNMILLCSDGVANVGRTSPEGIMRRVKEFSNKGITLSSFGFGMDNYNDVLMEQLAQKGNGRYAYINDHKEAKKVFVDDFIGTTQLLGRDMKVQVEFDPGVVKSYRLLGFENRDVPDHRFRDNRQDGGEVGAGHEVTALYELQLRGKRFPRKVATVTVRYKEEGADQVVELSREVLMKNHYRQYRQSRPELKLALVAGRFAEMVKQTRYAANTSYAELYRIAERLRQELPSRQTEELLELIRTAGGLGDYHTRWQNDDDGDYANYKR